MLHSFIKKKAHKKVKKVKRRYQTALVKAARIALILRVFLEEIREVSCFGTRLLSTVHTLTLRRRKKAVCVWIGLMSMTHTKF